MSGKFNKRFKRLTITLTFLVATSSLAYLLGWSSVLMVKEVKIEGSSEASLLIGTLNKQSIAPTVGQRLARVNVRSIERALSELDWLDNAEVSRNWVSSNISIKVSERVAIARALTNQNSIVNFDSSGFLFTPTSINQKKNQAALPLISSANNAQQDLSDVALLLQQIPADLEYLIADLDQISITKAGYILMSSAINNRPVRINWGTVEQIDQKFAVLLALLKLPENKVISQVDLSQPDAPIVK
jgi:cell division septal protein FtsQ